MYSHLGWVEVFFIPGGLPWLLLQTDRDMDESAIVWGACGIYVKGQCNQRPFSHPHQGAEPEKL